MKHTSLSGPPRTMMDMFKMLPEGTLAELIDNQIYMSPSPSFIHQIIQKKLTKLLDEIIEEPGKGFVIPAPFDVFLDESANAVQPDIVVILQANKGKLNREGPFKGIPDLVVEVLSSGNKSHDLLRKKELYERFGIQEYWLVDPETKAVMIYVLKENKYSLFAEDIGIIKSALLNATLTF